MFLNNNLVSTQSLRLIHEPVYYINIVLLLLLLLVVI